MFDLCFQCGFSKAQKEGDAFQKHPICPKCGCLFKYEFLPLLFVCGPSGAGKTTVLNELVGRVTDAVLLDGDVLWRSSYNDEPNGTYNFFETWLSLAKNIHRSGRSVVLFCSGAIPQNIEMCSESQFFSSIYYLALVYDDSKLRERLLARPNSYNDKHIAAQMEFNNWFKLGESEYAQKIELLDTSEATISETAAAVEAWIYKKVRLI